MSVHALLLNASMEPIKVITARRAVTLILGGKAEAIAGNATELHYAGGSVTVPSVVRLKRYVKIPYRATVPLTRQAVLARDNKTCQYCFKHGDTMDHVIPRAQGGKHVWENIVCACRRCNGLKGNRTPAEWGRELKTRPFAPKAWFYVVFRFEMDPAWEPYLPSLA